MASISRRTVLDAAGVALILAALPHAIHRIVQTGDPTYSPSVSFKIFWPASQGRGDCASSFNQSLQCC
jgi:hypothetical protein